MSSERVPDQSSPQVAMPAPQLGAMGRHFGFLPSAQQIQQLVSQAPSQAGSSASAARQSTSPVTSSASTGSTSESK